MPIRFRCVYCNQLLGIAHRKAGTIVRCTSCEGQLIVPEPSDATTEAGGSHEHPAGPPAEQPPKTENGSQGGVFDAQEFDAFLEPLSAGGRSVVRLPAPPVPNPARTIVEQLPRRALVLTHRSLTIAVALVVLGLGLAFAAGLCLGLSR
jgi:hypothetical protein